MNSLEMNSLKINSSVNGKTSTLILSLVIGALCCTPALAAERDPTQPIAYKAPAKSSQNQSGLTLNSVLVSSQRRQASINGKLVGEGDRIGDNKIITIAAEGVTIERNGKRRVLKLNTTTVKRAHARAAQ